MAPAIPQTYSVPWVAVFRLCAGGHAQALRAYLDRRQKNILVQGPPFVIYPTLATIRGTALSEAGAGSVSQLLKDHRYIFGIDLHTSRIKTDEPFLHAAIIAVIKQAILTDAMVCIATTAVYATLVEYCTTGERQPINFTEAAYEDTCRNHMKTIADTRVYALKALGQVLHRLYLETTETKSAQPSAGSSSTLSTFPALMLRWGPSDVKCASRAM
ncbi:hypothetical protein B0H14DRAFT_3452078 [Mycena olivaceomarginata]|nr:hypothetical protein B0H14DRAFT_3452078 [Mycena olivaceomarginata]